MTVLDKEEHIFRRVPLELNFYTRQAYDEEFVRPQLRRVFESFKEVARPAPALK